MKLCPYCDEPIWRIDLTALVNGDPRGIHLECCIRMAVGSVGHQSGECQCYGKVDRSEDGMTARQGALAALVYYRTQVRAIVEFGMQLESFAIEGKPGSRRLSDA